MKKNPTEDTLRTYIHGHILLKRKKKTGACTIALSSPENDKSQIRDKVFNEINLEDLKLIMVLKH